MKKFLFIIIALISFGAQAQTYTETQERVNAEILKFQTRLDEVKNQIYYLEVTLDKDIYEISHKPNLTFVNKAELAEMEKKKHFAPEDLVTLKLEKNKLEEALKSLKETGLEGTEYRTQSDVKSNLPEQMSPRQYRRYSRTQSYKLSEGIITSDGNSSSVNQFKGILINDKTGLGEVTMFYITRTDIRNSPTVSIEVDPGKRKTWLLAAGTYQVQIVCGAYDATRIFHVDPRVLNWVDNDYAYFGIRKNRNDW